jgi:hypothetical protein
MRAIAIDDVELNAAAGMRFYADLRGLARPTTAALTERARARLSPAREQMLLASRAVPFQVALDEAWEDSVEAFNVLAWGTFSPRRGGQATRLLSAVEIDPFAPEDVYQMAVELTAFGRPGPFEWRGELVALEPVWVAADPETSTASPLVVGGNEATRPVIQITGGASVTRRRVTLRDRTGHGVRGIPQGIAITAGEANFIVYLDGPPRQPYAYVGGRLYVLVEIDAGRPGFLDIYSGSAINNTLDAGKLDEAGLAFNAGLLDGTLTTSVGIPGAHPPARAWCWQPAITAPHVEGRRYTFGFDGETLHMRDREDTGQRVDLGDDADSWQFSSPVEIASVSNLEIEVTAGYLPGQATIDESGERVMRVTLATIDGSPIPDGPVWDTQHLSPYPIGTVVPDLAAIGFPVARHPEHLYYATFQFGAISFPNTHSVPLRENVAISWGSGAAGPGSTIWRNDYLPEELPDLAAQFLGCTVQTGPPGVWYLRFPAGAFRGIEPPLLSMSIQGKGGSFTYVKSGEDDVEFSVQGDTSLDNVLLFASEWVDPVTLNPPAEEEDAPVNVEPLRGQVRAVLRAWTRDSPYPATVWSQVVTGAGPDGTNAALAISGVDVSGAVMLAVGLEPAASAPDTLTWGTLRVTSNPVITLQSAKLPDLDVSGPIAAQKLDGALVNERNGQQIPFRDTLSDATGLEWDAETPDLQGVDGLGPVYGALPPSIGTPVMELDVGANDWVASGALASATIAFQWRKRWAV